MLTIHVADTTLFHVAAEQLGDATQWNRVASLNGLTDPMLKGVCVLLIPPYDASMTGGLPEQ